MHFETLHDILVSVSILTLVVLLMVLLFKKLHQPYLIAYILAGIAKYKENSYTREIVHWLSKLITQQHQKQTNDSSR